MTKLLILTAKAKPTFDVGKVPFSLWLSPFRRDIKHLTGPGLLRKESCRML